MQLRRFGNTDLEVSPICFGPMRFAAKDGTDDDASRAGRRALERALERGVNFVHSSYEYGTRWSVGKALAGHARRHEIHHVIKVPVPDFEDGGRFDAAKFRKRGNVEPPRRSVQGHQIFGTRCAPLLVIGGDPPHARRSTGITSLAALRGLTAYRA